MHPSITRLAWFLAVVVISGTLTTASGIPGSTWSVHITPFEGFSPSIVSIAPGDSIYWENHDTVAHVLRSEPGSAESWDSGEIAPGDCWGRRFHNLGNLRYTSARQRGWTGEIQIAIQKIDDEQTWGDIKSLFRFR